MLPNEKIQDEQEFNYKCQTYGIEAIKILDFISNELKEFAFSANCKDGELDRIKWKVRNLEDFKTTILNASTSTAPEFKL